jgi:hypothetical protein
MSNAPNEMKGRGQVVVYGEGLHLPCSDVADLVQPLESDVKLQISIDGKCPNKTSIHKPAIGISLDLGFTRSVTTRFHMIRTHF